MKIACFTPFISNSAIGHVTNSVFELLCQKYAFDIDIFTVHTENLIVTSLNVIHFNINSLKSEQLEKYDLCVYVMGNYHDFHRDVYLASKLKPGLIILHDRTMCDFWWSVFNHDVQPDLWLNEREMLFGKLPEYGKHDWKDFISHYDFLKMPDIVSLRPFAENVLGVFSHAEYFGEIIKNNFNLPYDWAYIPSHNSQENKSRFSLPTAELDAIWEKAKKQGRKVLLSTGIVHAVKRIDKVVAAIDRNIMLRENICYIVIGEYGGDFGENLYKLSEGNLKNCLHLMGRQSDAVMFKAIDNADLCVNLRYPNSEVCSLSLLEQMSAGKAVLVIRSGIYGEVPANAVVGLDISEKNFLLGEFNYISDERGASYAEINGEIEAIEQALIRWIKGEIDNTVGINAHAFITENVRAELYTDKFAAFIKDLSNQHNLKQLQDKFLKMTDEKAKTLFGDYCNLPHFADNISKNICELFNRTKQTEQNRQNKTKTLILGIWFAFPGYIPTLDREGIAVYIRHLSKALVVNHNITLEVWCYSWNIEPIKRIFDNLPEGSFSVATEKNCRNILKIETHYADEEIIVYENNYWNLSILAKHFSKADCFLSPVIYLDEVVYTGKPVYIMAHDLFTVYLKDMFIDAEYGKQIYSDTLERFENAVNRGAKFISPASSTRDIQLLPCAKALIPENVIIIPSPKYNTKDSSFISEEELRKKLNIYNPYLFYPTQIRPNKNWQLLIKAFKILLKTQPQLKLLTTGNLSDCDADKKLAHQLRVENSIIKLPRLGEVDLNSCYKYADCVPVSSMYEASFPRQAVEAISFDTPIVVVDSDINREELEIFGLAGTVPLIDPNDEKAFAGEIERVLRNRAAVVKEQIPLKKMLERTWENAADEFWRVFTEDGNNNG